jgi:hypothetical protein
MFDYVIGNQDRHQGNWMVGEGDGRIKLIDHGLAFGETRAKAPTFNQGLIDEAGRIEKKQGLRFGPDKGPKMSPPKDIARKYAENKSAILSSLKKLGLPPKAIARTAKRIDKAATAETWDQLYGDGF